MPWALPRSQMLQGLASPRACSSRLGTQRPSAASAGGKFVGFKYDQYSTSWSTLCWLTDQLDSLGAAYMFTGATAAWLQGAEVHYEQLRPLQVSLQWDAMKDLHGVLSRTLVLQDSFTAGSEHSKQHAEHSLNQTYTSEIARSPGGVLSFTASTLEDTVLVTGKLNTILHMSPERVPVTRQGTSIWCESLLSVRDRNSKTDPALSELVGRRLQELQSQLTLVNGMAWGQEETADAWGTKVGNPAEAAAWLQQDPLLRLGSSIHKHLPKSLSSIKLINLMGSNGTKAVAAALLGAEVTCVDISLANAQYGQQLAEAAGVDVEFVAADVLALPDRILTGSYDVVLLELGVLHYFIDLQPLMRVIHQLLIPGGILLLREFHPISTKLISSKGKKHKVTGDYFSQQLVAADVAYSKYTAAFAGTQGPNKTAMTVQLRQWGLGEVITSVAEAGMVLRRLEEEPGVKSADAGLPKIFTLVALKPS